MTSFKDNRGRTWTLALNAHSISRVNDLIGIDLVAPHQGKPPLSARLTTDPALLCDVLFALLKDDAEACNPPVTDEDFARGLGCDGFELAASALFGEMKDFCRKIGRGDMAGYLALHEKILRRFVQQCDDSNPP